METAEGRKPKHDLQRRTSKVYDRFRNHKKEKRHLCKKTGIIDALKSLDQFGEPVSLTYKGETAYKTLPGALMSIVVLFFMTIFSYKTGVIFVYRTNSNVYLAMSNADLNNLV